jgi:hypothetical protein
LADDSFKLHFFLDQQATFRLSCLSINCFFSQDRLFGFFWLVSVLRAKKTARGGPAIVSPRFFATLLPALRGP